MLFFCTKSSNPVSGKDDGHGMIEIRARVVNPPLAKGAAADGIDATVATKLVVEISGDDLPAMTIERNIDLSRPTVVDTVTKVPIGRNRRVVIWTVASNGSVTHIDSIASRTVNIELGRVAPVFATLIPAAGSIYLQFAGVAANSAIHASFTSLDGAFVVRDSVARGTNSRLSLSLDNIPHNTAGVLWVGLINAHGDTVSFATENLTFSARANNTINLNFVENSGMIGIDVAIYMPGVTTGVYNFDNKESGVSETGELVITEIMWSASNDNYFEIYNALDSALFFDTLIVEIVGSTSIAVHRFLNVSIARRGYLVFGSREQPHVDIVGISLVSTGNWITVKRKNGAVIDRVIFPGGSNSIEWPSISSSARRSAELARDKYCAAANNLGRNWNTASERFIESPATFGTPGR